MTYGDFYDIAEYGNEHWRGKFTEKEVAENAYEYLYEFYEALNSEWKSSPPIRKVSSTISDLLKLLDEDGSEQTLEYANMIRDSLGLCAVCTD